MRYVRLQTEIENKKSLCSNTLENHGNLWLYTIVDVGVVEWWRYSAVLHTRLCVISARKSWYTIFYNLMAMIIIMCTSHLGGKTTRCVLHAGSARIGPYGVVKTLVEMTVIVMLRVCKY